MKEYFDAAFFTDLILYSNAALIKNKQYINDLNVFPVPDGDTGTNMSLTIGAAVTELKKKNPDTLGAAADCVASALLRGARGNSGVILSLLFRGISKKLKGVEKADAKLFAQAMHEGVEAAYKAVMKPTEGTILTVSRVATSAALEFSEHDGDIELMMLCAVESARESLADTMNLNPVLKRAGVIDAGGQGYLYILEAALAVLRGEPMPEVDVASTTEHDGGGIMSFSTEEITFTYCTEFIVSRDTNKDPALLQAFLEPLGDSLVLVDDDEIIKVHVHTNEPGKALTEALTYGALLTIKIENMREQHTQAIEETMASNEPEFVAAERRYGVVVVSAGVGMATLFKELGADRIVTGGQTMNPSTEDILREINRTPSEIVFVFPNNKNIIMAAQQCIPLTEKKVVVVPTRNMPQCVSSLLCLDPDGEMEEILEAMNEASDAVHTASITFAARDSDFDGHAIKEGEYLSLLDGALVGSFRERTELLSATADGLAQYDPSLIAIYYGEDVSEDEAQETLAFFEGKFADAEFSLVNGGQSVYYYLISAE